MADVISEVRALKERAMLARDIGDFDEALDLLCDAERLLRRELDQLSETKNADGPGRYELAIKKQLYHILGSKGGVHRRAKQWREAIDAYDAGREVEKEFEDSYDLTQRLVVRALAQANGFPIGEFNFPVELQNAHDIIVRQMSSTRESDEYAAADRLTASLLLGPDQWRSDLRLFLSRASATSYARQVTRELLADLDAELGAKNPELGTRLREALTEIALG